MAVRALVVSLLFALPAAAGAQWTEGQHFERLPAAQARADDGRIEVVEVFWYGCPSCYNLEIHVQRWLQSKPADTDFVRVAASLAPSWRVHARAYYTADALGVVDRVHQALFDALHLERNPLNTVESIASVFSEHAGIALDQFQPAFASFGVDARMRRGDQFTRRHLVSSVPTVIVNGRYRTDPGRARGYENVMQVVDHLIELERARVRAPADR